MHRLSTHENKYSNIFFYKTITPTVLKFYMEDDLAPGSQSYKIWSGRISKMGFWLNFGMEYQWNIGIQNYKNEKNL